MSIEPSTLPLVFQVLRAHGYTVEVLPASTGKRVVVRCGAERWEGRGAGTRDAVDALLAQMLPSAAARAGLRVALEAAAAKPGASAPRR